MKKNLLLLLFTFFTLTKLYAQHGIQGTQTIDVMDTVIFDLSKAVINGNSVSFPVSIISDDTISALDFSFKYNHSNISYDTIIDLTTYLQSVSFYNSNDSTVRFTSYSLTPISKDTDLVSIELTLLSSQIAATDLNTLKAYLNGSPCSIKINLLSTSINEMNNNNHQIEIFPNPASTNFQLSFNLEQESIVSSNIFDLRGNFIRTILNQKTRKGSFSFYIDDLKEGVYIVRTVVNQKEIENKRVSIIH